MRYYYSDSIEVFCDKDCDTIIGQMTREAITDINIETRNSWKEEIGLLKVGLKPYAGKGSVFFEYTIPRMGLRADVIVVIDGIVFVLEFKTARQGFTQAALTQVWNYALDLKNFLEGSRDRVIVPILVAHDEPDEGCCFDIHGYEDKVFYPLSTNYARLNDCIDTFLNAVKVEKPTEGDMAWAESGYKPTPTIVEASVALFRDHTVKDITRHDGDIENTAKCINKIVAECRDKNYKAICFVTGVPGAGKTLLGLQVAIEHAKDVNAVYLSGNHPLVAVLQEALARDYYQRKEEEYRSGKIDRKCSIDEARGMVRAFIQMIYHYRDQCLDGMEVRDGELVQQEGYIRKQKDGGNIQVEHVAIFDEAQRAWTKKALADFMSSKRSMVGFPYSEPEFLISCMDRREDWGLIICLIGGGQEINKGEAGIREWIDSINRRYKHWHVYVSDHLGEKEYANGRVIELIENRENLHVVSALHLKTSMRSFRAENVSDFVHQLLELRKDDAKATLEELQRYPIALTRSLDVAKKWLREKARASERIGILASSTALRLKAISINVKNKVDHVNWFLEDFSDVRSSNFLEDVVTEFEVQGLEIDWACVAWDVDLRLNTQQTEWEQYKMRGGKSWQKNNNETNKEYQINAYRVLLTRARQGMVILVPEGNPQDATRKPEWYDGIYNYLRDIGLEVID